jgi:hypothetical protein
MRKLAVLLAAALMVSVPMAMTVTTDAYAAAKKGKRHHHRHHRAAVAAPAEVGVQPPFHAMWRAVDDLGRALVTSGR